MLFFLIIRSNPKRVNLLSFFLAMGLDTPSTVWDPAARDEVATLESQHFIETTSSLTPSTKSIEEDSPQPNMEESLSSGSPPVDKSPLVEEGEITQGIDNAKQDEESLTNTNSDEVSSPVNDVAAADTNGPSKEEDTSKVESSSSFKEDVTTSALTTSVETDNSGVENGSINSSTPAADAVTPSTDTVTPSTSNETNGNNKISREPSTKDANENAESSTEKVVENEHSEVAQRHSTDGGKTEPPQPEANETVAEGGVQPPTAETNGGKTEPPQPGADEIAAEGGVQSQEVESVDNTKPSVEA